MENLVIQRIKEFMDLKKISITKFSNEIGIAQITFSKQIEGDLQTPLNTIECILSRYSEISAEWLMRGKGSVHFSEKETGNSISGNVGFSNFGNAGGHIINIGASEYQKIIDEKRIEIQRGSDSNADPNGLNKLNREVEYLRNELRYKDELIKSKEEVICLYKEMLNRK